MIFANRSDILYGVFLYIHTFTKETPIQMGLFKKLFGDYSSKEIRKMTPIKEAVLALEEEYKALSDAELKAITPKLKERLANFTPKEAKIKTGWLSRYASLV